MKDALNRTLENFNRVTINKLQKMLKITLREAQKLMVNIASSFDAICTQNNIPYYMIGDTLLGAIRHKGFIPWDDDMDFGVPRKYYDRLLQILEKELPQRYKLYTYHNSENIKCGFAKIADTKTHISDPRIHVALEKQLGVNLDIFPLDCADNFPKRLWKYTFLQGKIWVDNADRNPMKNLIKRIFRAILPISEDYFIKKIEKTLADLKGNSYMTNVWGRYGKEKEMVPTAYYGDKRYVFENITLRGVENYDLYLKHIYSNYMQLPPEDHREAHADNIYIESREFLNN